MGVLSRSGRLPPSAALVRAMRSTLPVHMFPEGITRVDFADRGDRLFRGDLILLQLVGIERDDDGPLVSAEGRRRGYAGQGGKQRADAVDGVVLQFALRVTGDC